MTGGGLTAAALVGLLATPWTGPDASAPALTLHHARARVVAEPLRSVAAALEVDGGGGEEEPLVEAWAGWRPWSAVALRLGWQRAPFDLASARSFWAVGLPDRPAAVGVAGDLRGPGATARVKLLGETLSAESGWILSGDRLLATGRLQGRWRGLTLGVGGTLEFDAAVDLRIAWAGGEGSLGHVRGRSRLGRLARGSWAEIGQQVWSPRWRVRVRAETVDDDAARADTGDVRIWTGGIALAPLDGVEVQALWVHREQLDRGGVGVLGLDDDRALLSLVLQRALP